MTLSYLTPIHEMRDQIRRMFNDFNEEGPLSTGFRSDWMNEAGRWLPAIEVNETDQEVCVSAALPGMKPEDINVEISGNTLVLSGEAQRTIKRDDRQCHRSEFQYGQFMRSVTLPEAVKGDACTAEYHDGVLDVHLPKSEKTVHQRIAIKTS